MILNAIFFVILQLLQKKDTPLLDKKKTIIVVLSKARRSLRFMSEIAAYLDLLTYILLFDKFRESDTQRCQVPSSAFTPTNSAFRFSLWLKFCFTSKSLSNIMEFREIGSFFLSKIQYPGQNFANIYFHFSVVYYQMDFVFPEQLISCFV